jgi:hypothetical protein
MTVYLIPIARERYELYCESAAPVADVGAPSPAAGVSSWLRQRFAAVLHEAERERRRGEAGAPPASGWMARTRHRVLAWVAERIAEQRLLWNLRNAATATAAFPDDLTFAAAHAQIRQILQRDFDRHRRWLVIDGLLLVASAVLAIIPGPNVIAYYFAFRVVGHWLSMRGATQGLRRTTWSGTGESALTDLRALATLVPCARRERLQAIATELSLPHLPAFFDRITS